MNGASYYGTIPAGSMLEVTERIDGAHRLHTDYPLLPGDLLAKQDDGTFYKHSPGLGIFGFALTPEQEQTLRPTTRDIVFGVGGLDYFFSGDDVQEEAA